MRVELGPPGHVRSFWLQTSPEFGMKRLLAAGAGPIYQVTRAFRQDEIGPLHNPEFSMVEWYRPGDGLAEGMGLLADFVEAMLDRGRPESLSYAEAFQRYAGIDPHRISTADLIASVREAGIVAPDSMAASDRDGWLDLLLVEKVQPGLGFARPAIVYDFPASQAALAVVRPSDPPLAERFELYIDGIELANGYHELVDPKQLRRRMTEANALRRIDDRPPLPQHNRLLAAMEAGLPPSAGVALGFDRLVMLAVGAKSLAEVVAFPFDRA